MNGVCLPRWEHFCEMVTSVVCDGNVVRLEFKCHITSATQKIQAMVYAVLYKQHDQNLKFYTVKESWNRAYGTDSAKLGPKSMVWVS